MEDKYNPMVPAKAEPSVKPTPKGRKIVVTKAAARRYTVTVTQVQVTEEEGKIKRAIIEGIMKKSKE